ncbi:hypothetical protein [Neisseria sp. Ec49-e6-T10]|uniref:hypothetical protein n=1 Tax=Neisseria sp. Ec49-e6-T10 TaxID=3140744 RepID=UPI003EB7FAB0
MKKLLLLLLFSLAQAQIVLSKENMSICQTNNWGEIHATLQKEQDIFTPDMELTYCILPNGNFIPTFFFTLDDEYLPYDKLIFSSKIYDAYTQLHHSEYTTKRNLVDLIIKYHSGKSPTQGQIAKAKEQLRKHGCFIHEIK